MKKSIVFASFTPGVSVALQAYLQAQCRLIELVKQNTKDKVVALFNNFMMSRIWNYKMGGGYFRQRKDIKTSPYLENGHIITDDGEVLVKIYSAWMTRQMMKLGAHQPVATEPGKSARLL